jgi:prepilin-type N-terminal cleavage/methylation domain-containing protein
MIRLTSTTRRMTDRPSRRTPAGVASDNGQRRTDRKRGFTLVEVLVVIVILGILIALLLPAVNSALKTARNAAVLAEINQISTALTDFKSKYGDYPPSRFLAVEGGNYSAYLGDTTSLSGGTMTDPYSPGVGDINLGTLAQRSVRALRTFFPRMTTTGPLPTGAFYDFNGNGVNDGAYILHGHECLVLFLGGVPLYDTSSGTYGLTGLGKDPTNPFTNMIVNNAMYNANRQTPFFQFNPGRLYLDPNSGVSGTNYVGTGIPGYYDTLNSGPAVPATGMANYYAYFSAYGNGNYDPNDVNFPNESDVNASNPILLDFNVPFPTTTSKGFASGAISASPNPYTSTLTVPLATGTTGGTVVYQSPQTFQIISSGADGLYGVGGQYLNITTASGIALPFDPNNTYSPAWGTLDKDETLRQREYDNLTNFKSGTLQ